jgi:anthraniloyl-CoA monooxygenase
MRIVCLGGGPAGLYFALLIKQARPDWSITVVERHGEGDTFGWGVVFSDQTMEALRNADSVTHGEIQRAFRHWEEIDIFIKGRKITSGGHGFSGISRKKLLAILQARAVGLGVELRFNTEVDAPQSYAKNYDLVVGADGVNSLTRRSYAEHFQPRGEERNCRYLWLGSTRALDAFNFDFRQTDAGWFTLHAYRFDETQSTFIIETPGDVWRRAGLDQMSQPQTLAFFETLFADRLQGARLIADERHLRGSAEWSRFNCLFCRHWYHGNVVLLGDAAHTAHFSIGSGTKLAMEDAIVLAEQVADDTRPLGERLQTYQDIRSAEACKLQSAARNRMEWFENVSRYASLEPEQFAYSLLTASQRIGHGNLGLRDASYIAGYEAWFAKRSGCEHAVPPMFTPFRLRSVTLANRVVVSPMAMYACSDGLPGDFHLTHLGARALGGAGLVMTEMTAVSPDARITPWCAGLWSDAHATAWRRIVDFVHQQSPAKIGIQLGHAGPKGSTLPAWQTMDAPLEQGNWSLLAASPVAYGPANQIPQAMTRSDMDAVRDAFVAATRRAASADFDLLELHCAHGYLLSSFLCPLTNRRDDDYGGSIENRCRFPLEVFLAMREAWPADMPMMVRISAHDWAPGGNTTDDAVQIARLFKAAGADLIDVSSGQTTREAQPVYGRMYQVPFSDQIRNEVGIATMAVGNITDPDQVNTIIAAGRADLCALGRPHLAHPNWTQQAAARLGVYLDWHRAYGSGQDQLERELARSQEAEVPVCVLLDKGH